MRKIFILLALFASLGVFAQKQKSAGYPISPVPFTSVKVTDAFWGQRLNAARDVTIPLAFSKCEETGRYTNFSNAAKHLKNPTLEFPDTAWTFSFDDTDPFKTIEGASYLLQTYPDAEYKGKQLSVYLDSVIAVIGSAQESDGYLYTARTKSPSKPHDWAGSKRWEKVEDLSHEFYNLGHMVEGAIAHYQATGKKNFLNIAIRYADCVCREIGDGEGQVVRVPGHQIAEMALAKLYTVTGNKKYLNQAKFFLDKRGYTSRKDAYSQAHKPVIEQDEAVGHAVRAAYMYAGMADVAALTGDKSYIDAIDRIWQNIVSKKLYITGGIGATSRGEAFGKNYELPNLTAYCETCAAIGNVYVNYRLFLLHGESKYYDVLERSLYNGLISGMSLDGGAFFYPNPLASNGEHKRQPWFGCACCPSNICRFIPSIPGYVYAVKDNDVYVNLYMSNTADLTVNGKHLQLQQTTNYPWNGDIEITLPSVQCSPSSTVPFRLKLRIPGWLQNTPVPSDLYTYTDGKHLSYIIKVNGEEVKAELENGYFTIDRAWQKGDKVSIHFDMEARTVKAHDKVAADRGRVAVERGPIVYCAEWIDNAFNLDQLVMNSQPTFQLDEKKDILCGINELVTEASVITEVDGTPVKRNVLLTLIPYYAWCHRGSGKMQVWLNNLQELNTEKPAETVDNIFIR